ncbi:MAG: pitrilysin family protein [Daejeonella sp.]|uniref:M16 family metallopeptidase n=1 Tax=Daejeonella sp. TaxID=2805397 RepID=UPI00273620C4|nr:pitrilysin family protein [Daejeonella sp.]MDP3466793.1 pitrilysin family protein [Daejeonella sp.]
MKNLKNYTSIVLTALMICSTAIAQNTPAAFKVPAYEKFILPNGLTIYLMEQHEVPVISLSAIIPAGSIYDGSKSGLASLTAAGLQYGTKSYSKTKIEEELDFIGASLNTYANKESAGISSKFAAKDLEKVLPILKEVLVDPVFDQEEFEKERKRVLSSLDQAKLSPRNVINAYWDKFIFGDHVYANPVSGSPASVGKFIIEDLRDFYKSNYGPQGSAIAIVGDFNSKEMKTRLRNLFGNWKKSVLVQKNLAAQPVKSIQTSRVLLVNKEDARETTLYIGGLGIRRDNPDFVAIDVVNTVFGGRFTSWLNDELRVNSGLTYGARSGFIPLKTSGTFSISTFTATKTTQATLDKALEVLDSLHKNGFDENTLTSAKNYVKGQFPPKYETASQLAGLLTQMFWYGFNESFINNFQTNVDGLTVAKSKEIINKYFPRENLQFVLIGKSEDIKSIAAKYGPVTEKQIKADGF